MRNRFVHAPDCAALDTVYTFDRKRGAPATCTCRKTQKKRLRVTASRSIYAGGDLLDCCGALAGSNGNYVKRAARSPGG
jgi:hypothetical protein